VPTVDAVGDMLMATPDITVTVPVAVVPDTVAVMVTAGVLGTEGGAV